MNSLKKSNFVKFDDPILDQEVKVKETKESKKVKKLEREMVVKPLPFSTDIYLNYNFDLQLTATTGVFANYRVFEFVDENEVLISIQANDVKCRYPLASKFSKGFDVYIPFNANPKIKAFNQVMTEVFEDNEMEMKDLNVWYAQLSDISKFPIPNFNPKRKVAETTREALIANFILGIRFSYDVESGLTNTKVEILEGELVEIKGIGSEGANKLKKPVKKNSVSAFKMRKPKSSVVEIKIEETNESSEDELIANEEMAESSVVDENKDRLSESAISRRRSKKNNT